MSQELVSTFFIAPPPVSYQVRRPRLENLLGRGTGSRVSVIVGPAGSGKTVLARTWLQECSRPWSWFALEPAVADESRFTAGLVHSIQRAFPDNPLGVVDLVGDDRFEPMKAMAALVDDLVELDHRRRSAVVVIDDVHLLSRHAWDDLAWFVSHLPGCLHLVLATRSEPPLPLAELRAYGRLTEVHGDDLAFNQDETVELFTRYAKDRAEADDWGMLAADFHGRTAGWVAGLQLALLALERGAAPERLLDDFTGTRRTVAEFLLEQVLERQPDDIRRFLRTTSVVSTLEPSLCDALTGRDDSRTVLRQLARDQVLIYQIDGAVDTYVHHPMVAELLQHELRMEGADELPTVNSRASRWFEERGRVVDSIEYALHGSDFERVLSSVARNCRRLLLDGHRTDIARWLDTLPEEFVMRDPRTALEHCAVRIAIGHRAAWTALRKVLAAFGPLPPDLRSRSELFLAIRSASEGHLDRYEEHMARCRDLQLPNGGESLHELAVAWEAPLLSLHGRYKAGAESAVSLLRSDRQFVIDAVALSGVAGALYAAGDPAASQVAGDAVEAWRGSGAPHTHEMISALCISSAAQRDGGDLARAEDLASAALALGDDSPMDLLTVCAWLEDALVQAALGRSEHALTRIDNIDVRARLADLAPPVMRMIQDTRRELGDSRTTQHGSVVSAPSTVELTDREQTILRYLARSFTFAEIGVELYISRNTVKTHALRMYRKLGVSSRSAAVEEAYRRGFLSVSDDLDSGEGATG